MTSIVASAIPQELANALLGVLPRMAHLMRRGTREHGTLSLERVKLLFHLAEGPRRAGDLAQMCGLTRSTVTEMVEGLLQENLVRREEDSSDRRAVIVSLAPAGRREIQRFRHAAAAMLTEVLAHLDPAKRERLHLALADLENAFNAYDHAQEGRDVR